MRDEIKIISADTSNKQDSTVNLKQGENPFEGGILMDPVTGNVVGDVPPGVTLIQDGHIEEQILAELHAGGAKTVLPIRVKIINPDAGKPSYGKDGDSGFDLRAMNDALVRPGETVVFPNGIALELPPGLEVQFRGRSGYNSKTKIRVPLGTGDSNYRGELKTSVDNIAHPQYEIKDGEIVVKTSNIVKTLDNKEEEIDVEVPVGTYLIKKGDRISQAVISMIVEGVYIPSEELNETSRGDQGFGSSGTK